MSSSQVSAVKSFKKSAFSCDQCRKRKVKCGGEQPNCRRCIARNESCLYKLSPTLNYTGRLEARIKDLEDQLAGFQRQSREGDTLSPASARDESSSSSQTPNRKVASEPPRDFQGLRVDQDGQITYHGATSFFNLPMARSQDGRSTSGAQVASHEGDQRKQKLLNNAWQQRLLETLAETPEPFQFLLKAHWCWIQPLFNFVYRPAFTRDMEVLGPYYSHTLLNAMMSHSVRFCQQNPRIREMLVPYDGGAIFSQQARRLVFDELAGGQSTIPTVQTLLLLSAQECSRGNRTQAWLYSGMAFRLIEDMGICIDGHKFAGSAQLSDEDIEIRHRLFWSCYFWDKIISLYLGRSPTLQYSTVSPPQLMLDDSAETELWIPHGLEYPAGMEYPPTQAHSVSCFMQMCRLSEIFNQILIHLYDPLHANTEEEVQSCLKNEGFALKTWFENLPVFLKLDAHNLPSYCPPSHVATLNCLYHTFSILLYRPMLFLRTSSNGNKQVPDPRHLVECISSATSIIAIFDLFCRTFGDSYCILSLSYSLYTAASIFLLQIQAGKIRDDQALKRLEFCVSGLERVKIPNPVIGQASELILQELSKMNIILPSLSTTAVPLPPRQAIPPHLQDHHQNLPPIQTQSNVPFGSNETVQLPPIYDLHQDAINISSELLEAFSSLEPIEATVSGLHEFG